MLIKDDLGLYRWYSAYLTELPNEKIEKYLSDFEENLAPLLQDIMSKYNCVNPNNYFGELTIKFYLKEIKEKDIDSEEKLIVKYKVLAHLFRPLCSTEFIEDFEKLKRHNGFVLTNVSPDNDNSFYNTYYVFQKTYER